jgi:hypothetical protein
MAVQRLTAAYRSRPRPSSAPGAKASTMCSYYLDGEPANVRRRSRDDLPFYCGLGAVFKLLRGPTSEVLPHPRSLRTEQRARRSHQARELGRHRDPGPVDVLRDRCARRAGAPWALIGHLGPGPRAP